MLRIFNKNLYFFGIFFILSFALLSLHFLLLSFCIFCPLLSSSTFFAVRFLEFHLTSARFMDTDVRYREWCLLDGDSNYVENVMQFSFLFHSLLFLLSVLDIKRIYSQNPFGFVCCHHSLFVSSFFFLLFIFFSTLIFQLIWNNKTAKSFSFSFWYCNHSHFGYAYFPLFTVNKLENAFQYQFKFIS